MTYEEKPNPCTCGAFCLHECFCGNWDGVVCDNCSEAEYESEYNNENPL